GRSIAPSLTDGGALSAPGSAPMTRPATARNGRRATIRRPSNMIQITGNVYDGASVGDSDLTHVTQYPGGSAANRVTQYFYDWRDRLVASKQGVQQTEDITTHRPIMYYVLDNLGEKTTIEHFDGDGLSISSTGRVPQPP